MRLGAEVVGASFGRRDGHTNPLRLLAALLGGITRLGGTLRTGAKVQSIARDGEGFTVTFAQEQARAPRMVIAAGLGSPELARQVGLDDSAAAAARTGAGHRAGRAAVLPLPSSGLRQTSDGTVMIGATHEEKGFDISTTSAAAADLSRVRSASCRHWRRRRLVRQWAGLRIMTPDSYPIYAQSETHPGAFVALCHSGVTLAAIHATLVADADR